MNNHSNVTFETTYPSANRVAGVCSALSTSQVNELLKHAVEISERAKRAASFGNSTGALGEAGKTLENATDNISKALKKGKGLAADASAACEISEAVATLNDWVIAPRTDEGDLKAAQAFDRLFGGAAHFFEKLPPPFNQYGKLLNEICRVSFFSNIAEIMRHGQATPGGGPMQKVLDSMDHPN
jgi:hypothetical protein